MTSQTPLLLLHPLGSDGTFWNPVIAGLGRPVLSPDLPGHGSEPPATATIEGYAEAVVDRLQGEVVVVGISLGGLVAQELAALRPDLVAGLVLVDTVAVYPSPFRDTWPERAATARSVGLEPLADAMEAMWFSEGFRHLHPDQVSAARQRFVSTDTEGYARACEALFDADTTAALSSVKVPTLVVCGDQDAPAFVDAADELTAAVAGAEQRWLEGAKHASVVEQPEAFVATLLEFLARHRL